MLGTPLENIIDAESLLKRWNIKPHTLVQFVREKKITPYGGKDTRKDPVSGKILHFCQRYTGLPETEDPFFSELECPYDLSDIYFDMMEVGKAESENPALGYLPVADNKQEPSLPEPSRFFTLKKQLTQSNNIEKDIQPFDEKSTEHNAISTDKLEGYLLPSKENYQSEPEVDFEHSVVVVPEKFFVGKSPQTARETLRKEGYSEAVMAKIFKENMGLSLTRIGELLFGKSLNEKALRNRVKKLLKDEVTIQIAK